MIMLMWDAVDEQCSSVTRSSKSDKCLEAMFAALLTRLT